MTKNIFFTSDSHWSHTNIITYSNRPFSSTEEMNEALVEKWNSVVTSKDIVYHLGDFSFGKGSKEAFKYFNQLNGNKHLIRGNHDYSHTVNLGWGSVSNLKEIKVGKQIIVLCHFAMRVWNQSHRDSWQLHGHSHCTLPETKDLSFDVSADGWDYSPIHFEVVQAKMKWKKENPSYFDSFNNLSREEILPKIQELNKQFRII